MRMLLSFVLSALFSATPAWAGDLSVRVVDAAGKPVENAVVMVKPNAGVPAGPIRFPWGTEMAQQDIMFIPHVLIVPVGATVQFPNRDKVRHHIFSFSKPAKFEMKLFGKDETRSYTFTSTGTVALGCNIHDRMSAFIKVVDTPYAARTNAEGLISIPSIMVGAATLTVWQENMRAKDNEASFPIVIPASGTISKRIAVKLR